MSNKKGHRFFLFSDGKKGLSDIVVTLIIVLLAIVAIGVVWVVVRNILNSGTSDIDLNAKCLGINMEIVSASCANGVVNETCNITLSRTGTNSDAIEGVKLVFRDEVTGVSSPLISLDGDVAQLVGKTASVNTGVPIANTISKIEATPFFKDTSGREQLCSQTSSFDL